MRCVNNKNTWFLIETVNGWRKIITYDELLRRTQNICDSKNLTIPKVKLFVSIWGVNFSSAIEMAQYERKRKRQKGSEIEKEKGVEEWNVEFAQTHSLDHCNLICLFVCAEMTFIHFSNRFLVSFLSLSLSILYSFFICSINKSETKSGFSSSEWKKSVIIKIDTWRVESHNTCKLVFSELIGTFDAIITLIGSHRIRPNFDADFNCAWKLISINFWFNECHCTYNLYIT